MNDLGPDAFQGCGHALSTMRVAAAATGLRSVVVPPPVRLPSGLSAGGTGGVGGVPMSEECRMSECPLRPVRVATALCSVPVVRR